MTRAYQSQIGINASRRDAEPGTKFVRITVGDTVDLAPHCDLWMRGAKTAEVRRIYCDRQTIEIRVRPIVAGVPQRRLYTILAHHVLT